MPQFNDEWVPEEGFKRRTGNDVLISYITKERQTPAVFIINETCKKSHGVGGKTLRYKKNNRCVFCLRESAARYKFKNKNSAFSSKGKALRAFEEKNNQADVDPLFD